MSEDLAKERVREANWAKAIEGRRFKPCRSVKSHKRHTWSGPEPHVDGWYCMGYDAPGSLGVKK